MTAPWPGTIRLAVDADGPRIGALYHECRWGDHGVRWDVPGIGQWWLVAERGDRLMGAVQIIASQPMGYIGDIIIHPEERARGNNGHSGLTQDFGLLARILGGVAVHMLAQAGVQIVLTVINAENVTMQHLLERYGAVSLGHFTLMARRTPA